MRGRRGMMPIIPERVWGSCGPEAVDQFIASNGHVTYQEKVDGCRCIVVVDAAGQPWFFSKLGQPLQLPNAGPCPTLARSVLDGELIEGTVHVFDLLRLNGCELRQKPLRDRLAALKELERTLPAWARSVEGDSDGRALLARVAARRGEGLVRKQLDAVYGRGDWTRMRLRPSRTKDAA